MPLLRRGPTHTVLVECLVQGLVRRALSARQAAGHEHADDVPASARHGRAPRKPPPAGGLTATPWHEPRGSRRRPLSEAELRLARRRRPAASSLEQLLQVDLRVRRRTKRVVGSTLRHAGGGAGGAQVGCSSPLTETVAQGQISGSTSSSSIVAIELSRIKASRLRQRAYSSADPASGE